MIGEGGYGKVYRPYPVECDNTKTLVPKSNYIGKLVNTSNLTLQEAKKAQRRRKTADPTNTITIPLVGYCHRDLSNVTNPAWENNKYNLELIYPFAGREFISIESKKRLLCGFYIFFKRIADMNKKGLYHLDIKSENILKNKKNDIVLIDMDLSLCKNDMVKHLLQKKTFRDVVYYVWPPEINYYVNSTKVRKPISSIPSSYSFIVNSGQFTKTELLDLINRFLTSSDYQKLREGDMAWDVTTSDLYGVGMLLKMHMSGVIPELDALIRDTIEPIPSLRINWDEFLKRYRAILVNALTV